MNIRTLNRNTLSFFLVLLLSFLLTGCGGGDNIDMGDGTGGGKGGSGGDVVATLSWQPPTENTDDTPLTDLSGYRLYIGDSPSSLEPAMDIPAKDSQGRKVTEFRITSGDVFSASERFQRNNGNVTVYFALTAYNSLNIESGLSEVVSKTF